MFDLGVVPAASDAADMPLPDARVRFGAPERVTVPVPSGSYATDPTLTAEQTELLFATLTSPSVVDGLWSAAPPESPTVTQLTMTASTPKLSPDGLFLMVTDGIDIGAYRRTAPGEPWTSADAELAGIPTPTTSDIERPGTITGDGLHIVIYRRASANAPYQLYAYHRDAPDATWTENAASLAVLRALHPAPTYSVLNPHLTADGLTLVYAVNTHENQGAMDLWLARRSAIDSPFDTPRPLVEVNDSELNDGDPWLSPRSDVLWFSRAHIDGTTRRSEWGLYRSTLEEY